MKRSRVTLGHAIFLLSPYARAHRGYTETSVTSVTRDPARITVGGCEAMGCTCIDTHADASESGLAEQYAPARDIDALTPLQASASTAYRTSTRPREISDAEHFLTAIRAREKDATRHFPPAPTRASEPLVDDFDAKPLDMCGDDNVQPVRRDLPANDVTVDLPRVLFPSGESMAAILAGSRISDTVRRRRN